MSNKIIPLIWGRLLPDILSKIEVLARGELSTGELYKGLCSGANQLWLYHHLEQLQAWCITSIVDYDVVKRLRFLLLGGRNLEQWIQHIDTIERWAAARGCAEVEAWVRPGLRKKLDRFGYAKAYEVVLKKLNAETVN